MADSQTPSGADVYNAGYTQPSDSQIVTTGYYDPLPAYDEQLQNIGQSQNFSHQSKSDIQPINSGQQLPNNREQPPDYEQQPPDYEQQPPKYEQHPQGYPNVEYGHPQRFMEQHTIVEQPLQTTLTVYDTRRRHDQTGMACFVCLCCCGLTGMIALILSTKTNEAYKEGNYEKGNRYHTITRIFIAISVIGGIVTIVCSILAVVHHLQHNPM